MEKRLESFPAKPIDPHAQPGMYAALLRPGTQPPFQAEDKNAASGLIDGKSEVGLKEQKERRQIEVPPDSSGMRRNCTPGSSAE